MPEPEELFAEEGFSDAAPAASLVEAGFALEVADAPLLHAGLNLADIAHVLVLLEQRLIPGDSAQRLLRLLLEVHAMPAADFPYDPAYGDPYNCRERFFASRLGAGRRMAARGQAKTRGRAAGTADRTAAPDPGPDAGGGRFRR